MLAIWFCDMVEFCENRVFSERITGLDFCYGQTGMDGTNGITAKSKNENPTAVEILTEAGLSDKNGWFCK